jgi:hypothetical protein
VRQRERDRERDRDRDRDRERERVSIDKESTRGVRDRERVKDREHRVCVSAVQVCGICGKKTTISVCANDHCGLSHTDILC